MKRSLFLLRLLRDRLVPLVLLEEAPAFAAAYTDMLRLVNREIHREEEGRKQQAAQKDKLKSSRLRGEASGKMPPRYKADAL